MNFNNTFLTFRHKNQRKFNFDSEKCTYEKENYDFYNYDLLLKKGFTLNYYEQQKFQ